MRQVTLSCCVRKVALVSDYVIVQDFDEFVGFDLQRYSSLSHVLSELSLKFAPSYRNFKLRDTVFDHHCKPEEPQLIFSQFVISEAKFYFRDMNLNMGKSILDSGACLVPFAHYMGSH